MDVDEDALPTAALGERPRARTVAMQALYEIDATTHDVETVIRRRIEEDRTPPGAAAYVGRLVTGVGERREEIDRLIEQAAPAWPLDQMSRVDKSILRLAIFEMLFDPELSAKVAINEAVELAKLFGHDSSPKFINGVLGTIERETRGQRAKRRYLKRPDSARLDDAGGPQESSTGENGDAESSPDRTKGQK